jgi:ABC-2 type transport system permease protein
MQVFFTLLRRELSAFFSSLTGYIIISVVLLLLGLSFLDVLLKLNVQPTEAPVTEIFFVTVYFWLILLLTSPIMTMRAFALEKYSGTFETLMTSAVKDWQVVLAKFSGAFLFYLLTWLPLLIFLGVVRRYSDEAAPFSWGLIASTYLGMALIGGVYMAIGCFASSLTRSQIIAAMVSYGLGLAIFLLSLRSLMAAPQSGWIGEVFKHISMTEHMEQFARGIVDTRFVVLYLSMTCLFLFLTWKVVESRRWR